MLQKKQLTIDQALQKARYYCSYQERSHAELREKLYGFGLRKHEVEQVLSQLIEENYCNEERFAEQFAGGKFRMKQWGKQKIRHALQEKRVSEYCIRQALKQIDGEAYEKTLLKLSAGKWEQLGSERNIFTRMAKTRDYLLQKGYENDLIGVALQKLRNENFDN